MLLHCSRPGSDGSTDPACTRWLRPPRSRYALASLKSVFPAQAAAVLPSAIHIQADHHFHASDAPLLKRAWLWFNVLSLDAPVVAVVWQWLFARCCGVVLHWPGIVSLAISVWLIYAVDRLLDLKEGAPAVTARHAFTRRHRGMFLLAALAAFPALLWACLHLASVVIHNGLFLSFAVVLYILAVHAAPVRFRRLWPKELVVGVIFAMGTSLVVWSRMAGDSGQLIGPTLLFSALCWLNCVAIEHWEWRRSVAAQLQPPHRVEWDRREPHRWTRWVGRHLAQVASALALASLLLFASDPDQPVMLACALSACGLLWLESRSQMFSLDALRVMADAILLSPALLLLFHR